MELTNGLILALFSTILSVLVLASTYTIRKIQKHDVELAELKRDLVAIQQNCGRHQEWQTEQAQTLISVHTAVVKIAAKMDINI
jgi:hypothetical protein